MVKPKIYADFHNADVLGRLRLNCSGTIEDLAEQQVELHDGLLLTLYADDLDAAGHSVELLADGVVSFSEEENCWVGAIDWAAIRHASDARGARSQENGTYSAPRLKEESDTRSLPVA